MSQNFRIFNTVLQEASENALKTFADFSTSESVGSTGPTGFTGSTGSIGSTGPTGAAGITNFRGSWAQQELITILI